LSPKFRSGQEVREKKAQNTTKGDGSKDDGEVAADASFAYLHSPV
jgi:hypothetical protein